MTDAEYENRPAINFDKLRKAISDVPITQQDEQQTVQEAVTKYAPPRERERERVATVQSSRPSTQTTTSLQNIAKAILALSWRDGELMGKAIDAKKSDNKSTISAMMDWAFEWETFKEEERPTLNKEAKD